MSERETAALTPAMLSGTPVGGPGGMAVCDTCNRRLTDGHREHDPTTARPTPYTPTPRASAERVDGRSAR